MDKAVDYLREKGMAKAAEPAESPPKASLTATFTWAAKSACFLELNCGKRTSLPAAISSRTLLTIYACTSRRLTRSTAKKFPQTFSKKKRLFLKAQALEEGKPEAIVERMVEGRIKSFLRRQLPFKPEVRKRPVQDHCQLVVEATATIGEKDFRKKISFASKWAKACRRRAKTLPTK